MARNPWLLVAAFIGLVGGGSLFGTGLARAQNETRRAERVRRAEKLARVTAKAERSTRKQQIEAMAKAGGAHRPHQGDPRSRPTRPRNGTAAATQHRGPVDSQTRRYALSHA